ncbi:site-specific DNA-methyltransferase [Gemmobacter aquarius]|uniref:site-specific DNA-methyltransferase (adenine-specific) n=1 Tax=Paragemmobacter aquarius TaxID=2169400 RepID=A0A2S0UJA6_9RHOB|nr:site-specific DNA-methyltransferase [Gemmobacter aquarius]AWB47886.1 site-specific DNA-methyltransferase [Gemmobacter aquarius]
MAAKTKLELTWIGKDIRPRLEPRILIEEPEFSYHAKARREGDSFENLLIHGDNLLALKALETDPAVRGKVKCIFIDPPYNTGSAFEHYDDGLEHSLWLGMMRDRLEILRNLLSDDGSIWITIDDNEAHYLKIICDEVFGRGNFVSNVIWAKRTSPANDAKYFSTDHDNILVFAKSLADWKLNRLSRTEKQNTFYKNPDNDSRGPWNSVTYTGNKNRNERPNLYYAIKQPNTGEDIFPPDGLTWRYGVETHNANEADKRLYWGKDGNSRIPRMKMFLSDAGLVVPRSIWPSDEVGSTQVSMNEQKALSKNPFATPKPELLLARILEIATNPGELVLDSFAGSGTTGAVAHKMGRRWIMVELGEHAKTHIVPRMQKVIDGTDKGGVTEAAGWKGGGGYRFCRLAPSLLEKDAWGNWVIRKEYNPAMLAEAMCKHFNYAYAPSTEHYWMHGSSSETSFIYVTTSSLTFEQLRAISDEVGENRSLLICCTAYEAKGESLPNLTLRKIPGAVLDRCEWGKDDYSLKISALPMMADEEEDEAPAAKKTKAGADGDLFDDGE